MHILKEVGPSVHLITNISIVSGAERGEDVFWPPRASHNVWIVCAAAQLTSKAEIARELTRIFQKGYVPIIVAVKFSRSPT
jgi:hypothetical protein